ncbi:IDEAL domain-containing protein [Bacillus timonensis]|nr:IDEAL domain-containing protein [Bacillus timonensis]
MNHFNQDQKNELMVISQDNVETIYEKEAEMVLAHSLLSYHKEQLMEKIDGTLINRDEQLFMELSKQYITLLTQYSYLN